MRSRVLLAYSFFVTTIVTAAIGMAWTMRNRADDTSYKETAIRYEEVISSPHAEAMTFSSQRITSNFEYQTTLPVASNVCHSCPVASFEMTGCDWSPCEMTGCDWSPCGCESPSVYLTLSQAFGQSIYTRDSYGQLQLYSLPYGRFGRIYPILQGDLIFLHHNQYAGSLGLGLREEISCGDYILGANAFSDFRGTAGGTFSQIGFGVECFYTPCNLGLWINGYFPVGNKSQSGHSHTTFYPGDYVATSQERFFIYQGFDAYLEKLVLSKNFCNAVLTWYTGLGTYGLWKRHEKSAIGLKAKVKCLLNDSLSLEFRYSYDKIFDSTYQGVIALSLPLDVLWKIGNTDCCCETNCCYQPPHFIQRNDMPVINRKCCYNTNF